MPWNSQQHLVSRFEMHIVSKRDGHYFENDLVGFGLYLQILQISLKQMVQTLNS